MNQVFRWNRFLRFHDKETNQERQRETETETEKKDTESQPKVRHRKEEKNTRAMHDNA